MQFHGDYAVPPPDERLVTAQEALEPLYETVELRAEAVLLTAAVQSGWSARDAALALAKLRLRDALTTLEDLE